jgi:hypothetical protein
MAAKITLALASPGIGTSDGVLRRAVGPGVPQGLHSRSRLAQRLSHWTQDQTMRPIVGMTRSANSSVKFCTVLDTGDAECQSFNRVNE